MSFNEFMQMGYDEFSMKLSNIPESEPLYKIIKSRSINTSKIKDKEEKKYWNELKRINKIPDVYKSVEELNETLKKNLKNGGLKYVK